MRVLILLLAVAVMLGCESENEEDLRKEGDHPGLVAYYPLDSSFTDESGNGHLLQVYGEPEFMEGYDNEPFSALLLDGETDYLRATVGLLDSFAISMWVRSYRYFVGEWPHWRSVVFDYSNKQVCAYVDGVSGATRLNLGMESVTVAGFIPDNMYDWFHLYVDVGNELRIFYNGSLTVTEPVDDTIAYKGELLYLGRASEDDEIELTYFYGLVDEIRIYDRLLEQSEIDELSLEQ